MLGPWQVFSHFPCYPLANWALLVLIPSWGACIRSRTLWVSPTNSPVRLGISLAAAPTPTGVFSQRFEALFSRAGALGCVVCLAPQLFSRFICARMWDPRSASCCLTGSSPPQLPVSTPPTSLGEWFFFNSLVVGLPYRSVFWLFWLFFVFKFVVVLLLGV